jgi:putative drug exporter of the RND superfamily
MKLSTETIARACATHPWRAIAGWLAALVVAAACIATLLGGRLTTDGAPTNNPQSQRAEDIVARSFSPQAAGEFTDIVIVRSPRFEASRPQFRSFVADLLRQGQATHVVAGARSYLTSRDRMLISRDGHATMIPIDVPDDGDIDRVMAVVERADANPAFAVSITGSDTLNHDFNELSQHDLKTGELQFGLPAALIILILVFGAVVAGLVPLLMAIISIVVALGLVAILAQEFGLSVFVVNMLTGMGLALGIDYSLFVVSRYREERGHGLAQLDAITTSGATASRAVLFSGTAFVVAMFGMLIVPSSIMQSLAAGAILVGIVSVLAALTLLPALLGLLGDRVNALRIPIVGSRSIEETNPEGRFWRRIVEGVQRRPTVSLLAAVALLLAAASPILGMNTGAQGVASLPDRFPSRQGFRELQNAFPNATANPAQIVVADHASSPAVAAALTRLKARLAADPRFGPGQATRSTNGDAALLTVPVRGDSAGESARAAVKDLRSTIIPAAFAGTDGTVYVGGDTADNIDYIDSVTNPAPYVFAFVLGLTLILLTIVFRSIVIAATAVALNLLSVGAAYGLLVLVFQHEVGAGLLGFTQADTIEAWVPLFLFSVLFGLSMDYQVFLLSRIRERYLESGDSKDAVAWGVASTARLITGAALIIVAVFIGFAMGDLIMFQQMGFGVAIALLIDATIIRSVLVPAAMTLLGRWNWYLPQWLRWLPEVHLEGGQAPAARYRTAPG